MDKRTRSARSPILKGARRLPAGQNSGHGARLEWKSSWKSNSLAAARIVADGHTVDAVPVVGHSEIVFYDSDLVDPPLDLRDMTQLNIDK